MSTGPARGDDEPALAAEIRSRRSGNGWGRPMRAYRSVGSTNTVARNWAREGAPEGALVVSEAQTRGRGRRGRSWHAEPGRSLLFSLVLRPDLPDRRRGMVTVAGAVAVAETCAEVVGEPAVEVKWPNDVLVNGRKCCGMLLESAGEALVLGVGCNVNQVDFPADLADRATSLRLETGRLIERSPFLIQLLARIRGGYDDLGDGGSDRLVARYEARMRHREKPVRCRIEQEDRWIEAVPLGLDPTGGLRVEVDGSVRTLRAGEVTFRTPRTRPSADS